MSVHLEALVVGMTYDLEGNLYRANGKLVGNNMTVGYKRCQLWKNNQLIITLSQARIIFFLHYGYWPIEVDHKDRDRSNNRPSNLRDITRSLNQHNKGLFANNTSGTKGVSYNKTHRKEVAWKASICIDGKRRTKGFETKEEAIAQRKEWECLLVI